MECSCGLLHDERLLVQDAVDGGAGDAVASGQLTETLPALAIAEDRRPVQFEWLASDMSTFESSAARAGADPLDDQTSLQLADGADNDDHGAAQRSAGIDLLPEGDELDAEAVQLVEDFEEVADRAGDAIEGPDQNDVEASVAGIAQDLVQTRAPSLHA